MVKLVFCSLCFSVFGAIKQRFCRVMVTGGESYFFYLKTLDKMEKLIIIVGSGGGEWGIF